MVIVKFNRIKNLFYCSPVYNYLATMGKYGKYTKKYNKEWESESTFKGWLQESKTRIGAYCKICKKELRAHKTDLQKHAETQQHTNNMKKFGLIPLPSQTKLSEVGICTTNVSNEKKIRDIKFSVYVAMHAAIMSVDHLSELINDAIPDQNLKLHRTKCTAIIRNVISPALLEALVADLETSPFSLILDESTDISVAKYLAVCIRYFSSQTKTMRTEYLGMIEVARTRAEDLYESLKCFLKQININIKNLVGIGTDGAANLCGVNHSLYTLLKNDVPTLVLIKCVCHSIHICASKAVSELPSSLDFLVRESKKWFSDSTLRKINYEALYMLINDGNKPHKLVAPAETRWLSRYQAVKIILEQWIELREHFKIASIKEKCFTARLLSEMYHDNLNYLYLYFLKPLLGQLNETNLFFQSQNVDIFVAYNNLKMLIVSFSKRILKLSFINYLELKNWAIDEVEQVLGNELAFCSPADADLGYTIDTKIKELKIEVDSTNTFKLRCLNFIKKSVMLLLEKLPHNIVILEKLKQFTPTICLNNNVRSFHSLPLEYAKQENIEDIELQWRNLTNVQWADYIPQSDIDDTLKFWTFVKNYSNAIGEHPFDTLASFVIKLLTFPISNAVVERVFSLMNIVKTRIRNKLTVNTLDAILRIKLHCYSYYICCKTFKPSQKMIELLTSNMYINLVNTFSETNDIEIAEVWQIVEDIAL